VSAFYECLRNSDFGFVHQVLSFERIHPDAVSSGCKKIRTYESAILRDLISYGPIYLAKEEYEKRLHQILNDYYSVLAVGLFNGKGREYWDFHQRDLKELGYSCYGARFAGAVCLKLFDFILNPKQTVEKLLDRIGSALKKEDSPQWGQTLKRSRELS